MWGGCFIAIVGFDVMYMVNRFPLLTAANVPVGFGIGLLQPNLWGHDPR